MGNKIWQTGKKSLNPLVEKFTVGDDFLIDRQLVPYDIKASLAHAEMLHHIGLLNKKELVSLNKGLSEILTKWKSGTFIIDQDQEDSHTAIEQFLTDNYGDVGKKIHTGRSRNDQSLTMIRLFTKEKLTAIESLMMQLSADLKNKIKEAANIPMPGYTHMQKAMPTDVAAWLDSYLSAINDAIPLLKATGKLIDQNPLGSASGFGIKNFPLDRKYTTQKLGFGKTQVNPLYCAFSRGYFDNIVLQTLSAPMIILGRLANDMMMFTMQEFQFFHLPESFTTGSSIMPQKKNYDLFEIMRGNTKVFHSYQSQIQEIISSLGSGYHRDLQLTKKPLVSGINLCEDSLTLMSIIINNLEINEAALKNAMTDDLFATEEVYKLVRSGETFRDAYIKVKNSLNNGSK